MRLLLVEDDDAIAEPLVEGLGHHGFVVERVRNGAAALAADTADLILLDLGLPDVDGLDVCRQLRARSASPPVIMLTARGEEIDRVVGLELGADDYLVKPFGLRELVARIRAVLRRVQSATPVESVTAREPGGDDRVLELGALVVDLRRHRVTLAGSEVALTPKEFGVLAVLAADAGAVVSRSTLIERVWDEHWYGPTKTLDVHVASIRKKLGDPRWIETVRSVGFRLARP